MKQTMLFSFFMWSMLITVCIPLFFVSWNLVYMFGVGVSAFGLHSTWENWKWSYGKRRSTK